MRAALLALVALPALLICALHLKRRTADEPPVTRIALVVGIQNYPAANGWRPLKGAATDARQFRHLLEGEFSFKPADVHVLIDEQASREAILAAFRNHLIGRASVAEGQVISVFYFSGHASTVHDKDGDEQEGAFGHDETICAWDSVNTDGAKTDIIDDELGELFDELSDRSTQTVGIFDCCYAGTIVRSDESFVGAFPVDKDDSISGPIIMAASRENELASESEGLIPRGWFSAALERAMVSMGPMKTWRDVHERVVSELFWRRRLQKPLITGPADQLVFEGKYAIRPRRFPVIRDLENKRYLVRGGLDELAVETKLEIRSWLHKKKRLLATVC